MAVGSVDKIRPQDPRVQYKTANLNGITYSYILAEPATRPKGVIFLIHGFPDLSFGWRYQIPLLTAMGLRVVAPDMMGYGGTEAPHDLKYYTYKRACDDMAELARQLGYSRILLGGHDWGGAVVYRFAMLYPKLIAAFFSVCTPFAPVNKTFKDMTVRSNFKYQLQFIGSELENVIKGEEKMKQMLTSMYGGRGPNRERGFDVTHGVYIDNLDKLRPSPLLSQEEIDFYAKRYALHPDVRGPLSWYRTQQLNWEEADAAGFTKDPANYKFDMPMLFVVATKDGALLPSMSVGMEKYFRNLTRGEVEASHWALWEKPAEVNRLIEEFLDGQISSVSAKL
ncbi:epoxide hydrolase [Xylogone sp. PMI_703]|nr:epoxide hydrolase [Xylogone sp. PMI_703]